MCVCVCEGVLFREFCLVFPTTSLLQNKLGPLCECYSNFQVYKYQIYITDKEVTTVWIQGSSKPIVPEHKPKFWRVHSGLNQIQDSGCLLLSLHLCSTNPWLLEERTLGAPSSSHNQSACCSRNACKAACYGAGYLELERLPRWLSGKESACQCRRYGFNPWIRKIPWSRKWKPTPVLFLKYPMDRGAWQATIHRVTKESGVT